MIAHGGDRGDQYDETETGEWDDIAEADGLDLDDDGPLPWLESSDYDEVERVDTGRIVGFMILALLALGLIIGLFWLLANRGSDPELAADGSTVAAPAGPLKERPKDPGGKVFEGTGDVAPAVGEGRTPQGKLAEAPPAPAPSPTPSASASPAAQGGGAATAGAAPSAGGVGVQVGAYSSKASAEQGWQKLQRQTDALSGYRYRIEEAQVDIGKVYRLQAVAGDRASANRLCSTLKSSGIECSVR